MKMIYCGLGLVIYSHPSGSLLEQSGAIELEKINGILIRKITSIAAFSRLDEKFSSLAPF